MKNEITHYTHIYTLLFITRGMCWFDNMLIINITSANSYPKRKLLAFYDLKKSFAY